MAFVPEGQADKLTIMGDRSEWREDKLSAEVMEIITCRETGGV